MSGGRPLKFESPEKLQAKIDEFFEHCEANNKLPTITYLAVFLDTSRETLKDYQTKYGDEFSDTVARAKQKIEAEMEDMLYNKHSARGAEFTLKNNFGWKEEQHLDHTSGGEKIEGFQFVKPEDETDDTSE